MPLWVRAACPGGKRLVSSCGFLEPMIYKVIWEMWTGNKKELRRIEFSDKNAALKFIQGLEQMPNVENAKIEQQSI